MSNPENSQSREIRRMGRTFEQIETALRSSAGVKAVAAKMLGVHRQRVFEWVEADPALKAVCIEIIEENLDLAEGQLLMLIKDGDAKSVQFFLDRIGRSRGYGSKVALSGDPTAAPITMLALPDFSGTTQNDRDALRAILSRDSGEPDGGASGA